MEVYGFDDGKYGRPKFDDGSSCSPFGKIAIFWLYHGIPYVKRRIHIKGPIQSVKTPAHHGQLSALLTFCTEDSAWEKWNSSERFHQNWDVRHVFTILSGQIVPKFRRKLATLTSTNVEPTKNYDFDKQTVDPFLTKNVDACRQELQKVCNHRNR